VNDEEDRVRFSTQLSQIEAMGFTDQEQNLRALRATNGIVHTAVDRILGGI
jgi:ubiquilin